MLSKKLPRSSINPSKKIGRRLKVIFGWIKRRSRTLFVFSFLLLVTFFVYNLFSVKTIQCSFNSGNCPHEIVQKLNSNIGSNSIFINQKKLVESIKTVHPISNAIIGFRMFNTLEVSLEGNSESYKAEVFLVKDLPLVTFDEAPGSTISSDWPRPTEELSILVRDIPSSTFDIWENGSLTPTASSSSILKYILNRKPDAETLTNLYKILNLSFKYLDPQEIYVLNTQVFLRQVNQPDIIVNIPFDEAMLIEAFQSINYLATIKKDTKVIDLRFKNPIIR